MKSPIAIFCSCLLTGQLWATAYTTNASTVPLSSSAAGSYTPSGNPGIGDTITVASPWRIDGDVTANFTPNGANAQVTWDGHSHAVTQTAPVSILLGCGSTGTAGCATAFVVDTCATSPSTATATGSASASSTALTVSGVSGTIENGMAVFGVGISPGTTVTGSGVSWTLSIASNAAVSGSLNFVAVITWSNTGLTSAQGFFDSSTPLPPSYTVNNKVCYGLFKVGVAGSIVRDIGQFGPFDSNSWLIQNVGVIGGSKITQTGNLGSMTMVNVSSTGSTDAVWFDTTGAPTETRTATAGSGATTITLTDTYGLAVGARVTGTNIQNGTVVVSFNIYPGTQAVISLPTSGALVATPLQFFYYCSFTNVTQVATSSANFMINDFESNDPECTSTGLAVLGDSGGTVGTGMSNASRSLTNSLEHNYFTTNSPKVGILSQAGTSTNHNVVTGNAVDGMYNDYIPSAFDYSTNNFFAQLNSASAGQGAILAFGTGNPWVSRGDIVVNDSPLLNSSYLGILALNNTNGVTASSPQPDIGNMTIVMNTQTNSNNSVVTFGETNGGTKFSVTNAALHDSILGGGWNGFSCADTGSTFLTNGTGGVGVYNNDIYATGGGLAYDQSAGSCPNFGAGHPSNTYGDVNNVSPGFIGTTQYPANSDTRWALADTALGGTGTVSNMFNNVLFGRWSGVAPIYTTSQVVGKLRAPFAPTASAVKNAGSANAVVPGGYIGAMPPAASSIKHRVTQP